MKAVILGLILCFFAGRSAFAQNEYSGSGIERDFSISSTLNYVSSASIQNNAFSSNVIERNTFTEVKGGYGYGFSLRKKLFRDDLSFSITTEYVKIVDEEQIQFLQEGDEIVRARATETLWMVPVEFSGSFILPRITENLIVYLGGGIGMYFGNREREFLNLKTETISKQSLLNLHILSGAEYFFENSVSAVFELRFREGQYEVNSAFPTDNVVVDGTRYFFQKDYNSKIFIDGLKVSLGISYYFK